MGITVKANSDITYVKIQPIISADAATENIAHPRSSPYRESRIENIPLTIRTYNEEPLSRHVRSDDVTTLTPSEETTDSEETTTEIIDEINTDDYEVSRRPPSPRFYSKLSYFKKSNEFNNQISTNLIETHPWRRKFKSKCRCERIWNCPKIQISVPRCPEEYFMCCFN